MHKEDPLFTASFPGPAEEQTDPVVVGRDKVCGGADFRRIEKNFRDVWQFALEPLVDCGHVRQQNASVKPRFIGAIKGRLDGGEDGILFGGE